MGRFDKNKGIFCLLNSFSEILTQHLNCRLVIVGYDGNIKQILKGCNRIWNKTTITGQLNREELFDWYQIADIGVIPSYSEQCSYVGIEMMMHQMPIVASDGYGVRNMFQEGENALIAAIGNRENDDEFVQNLANRILELLEDDEKRERIARGARKAYEERYTIDRMKEAYLQLLDNLWAES